MDIGLLGDVSALAKSVDGQSLACCCQGWSTQQGNICMTCSWALWLVAHFGVAAGSRCLSGPGVYSINSFWHETAEAESLLEVDCDVYMELNSRMPHLDFRRPVCCSSCCGAMYQEQLVFG